MTPEPGDELLALDAEIHRRVFGRPVHLVGRALWVDTGTHSVIPHYSRGIAAAWLVVERLRNEIPTFDLRWCYRNGVEGWAVYLELNGSFAGGVTAIRNEFFGDTAPLAICRAALAAVGAPSSSGAG